VKVVSEMILEELTKIEEKLERIANLGIIARSSGSGITMKEVNAAIDRKMTRIDEMEIGIKKIIDQVEKSNLDAKSKEEKLNQLHLDLESLGRNVNELPKRLLRRQ